MYLLRKCAYRDIQIIGKVKEKEQSFTCTELRVKKKEGYGDFKNVLEILRLDLLQIVETCSSIREEPSINTFRNIRY